MSAEICEYPTELADELRFLPGGELTGDKNGKTYRIAVGLTALQAAQLQDKSREEAVMKNCPNDAKSRFRDLDATKNWQKKGRLVLTLLDENGDFAGIAWMGPGKPEITGNPLQKAWRHWRNRGLVTTFAIRLYGDAVGQKLASPFTEVMLKYHGEHYSNKGVWLEAWRDNPAAIKPYIKNGFREFFHEKTDDRGKIRQRVRMKYQPPREVPAWFKKISHFRKKQSDDFREPVCAKI